MLLNNSILTSKFCKHITDGTHDSPKYISSGYHLVTSKYIKSNKLDLDSSPFISQEDFDKINQRSKIENGDILFSMIGTVGDVAIVKNPNFAIKNMGLFRCCNQIDSLFLFYFFQSTNAHNLFNSLMTGSTQQYLTLNALKNIPIPNYSNELKQHIVDTIGSVDDYIEKLQKFNIKIDMLISQLVADFLKNNMCTELRISDCAIVKNGYAFKPTDYLPYPTKTSFEVLKMGHIEIGGGLKFNPKKDFVEITDKLKKFQLLEDDIVMGMTDMKDKVVILGVPALIDESNKYLLNQRVAQIVAKKINPIFLYYQMKDKKFIKDLQLKANKGVQVNLTTDAIKNMTVYNTNDNVFLEKLSNLYDMIKTNNLKIRKSFILKETLLKKYFG